MESLFGCTPKQPNLTIQRIFHVYYQENDAVFTIAPIELTSGTLPRRQQRLVEAWAELHQGELLTDWQRLLAKQNPLPIDPLK